VAVDRDRVLQAAQKLVERKRYDKAVVEYQKLVADDPKDVRTLLKIGDLYLKMEQHVDAITTYERVGQFYSQQGFALKAIAVYKQIREIIHKHVPHLEDRFGHIVPKLAEIYTQLGLISEALAAYDEVATRFQRAGRDRDAIDVFRKVVDLDPQNPLPYLRLGEAFIRIKDVDNAIQRFGSAAEILLKQGRRDDALKVVERLLQHRPEPKFSRIAAEIYLDRGNPSDGMAALTKLQIAFKDNPKDLETLALLARAFDKLGQPAKAIEVQKESARIAKEANKTEQFNALVDALVARAPNDEGVRALASQRVPSAHAPSEVRSSVDSIDVEVDQEVDQELDQEYELEEDDVESVHSETPFPLPQSRSRFPTPSTSQSRQATVDPVIRTRQIIAQAEVHRRREEYDDAIAALMEGIEEIPAARELREKLCDLLSEAGDQTAAVRQMLDFARWLSMQDDLEGAVKHLDEVLLLEPGQPDAIEMLREFGYSVSSEAYPEEPAAAEYGMVQDGADSSMVPYPGAGTAVNPYAPQGSDPYDPNAPLPSYPLDDVGSHASRPGHGHGSGRPFLPNQIDDPFGEAPLPRYPIDEEATTFLQLPPPVTARSPAAEAAPVAPSPQDSIGRVRISERHGGLQRSEPAAQLDEDSLEEVDFFASRGMFNEAREMLEEQLVRLPNHPLLLERKRDLEAMAAGHDDDASGTRVLPRSGGQLEDRSFDIAAAIDAIDAIDVIDAGTQAHQSSFGDTEQVSVDEVFQRFKEGVAAQISPSDAATHYDLGVAYKEMGLYADAIKEFELASRDPNRECVCQSMVGTIHLQMGNIDPAIDAFIRGLHASVKTREQELALTYEIGECYQTRNAPDQALYYFQRVARIDPAYRDPRGSVMERIRRLESRAHSPAARPAVRTEAVVDEFDAALDDLLGGTDLP
jgi:tetratricopeptide (TPR) repeat protein